VRRNREQSPYPELDPQIVAGYSQTFIARHDCYPVQRKDGKYVSLKHPLTPEIIKKHLWGLITIGAYALDSESKARWLCFDADTEDQWHGILALALTLERQKVVPYRERSRRGGHLWLFFSALPSAYARKIGLQLLVEHNLKGIELYPKQDQLTSGIGSLVRLPLGVHRKTGQRYSFVDRDGQPLAPTIREQLAVLAYPTCLTFPFIMRMLARVPPSPPAPKPTPAFRPTDTDDKIPLSERLKRRISVLEFVSRYTDLDERNMGLCPFHDDQHKSFGVNDEGNYWHCFAGCGGGSIIDFFMKWREKHGQDASFTATITELRKMLL
jgi:hypothetical protein